jgi:hypothetical protein
MKKIDLEGSRLLHYAYGLVMVFDATEKAPQARWTQQHEDQGFARREHSVLFATLKQEGKAIVNVFNGWPNDLSQSSRVIAVQLSLSSALLNIRGLEEWPIDRFVRLVPGSYTVILSQRLDKNTGQLILDFFVDSLCETRNSRVLKADEALKVPGVLLETADPVRE